MEIIGLIAGKSGDSLNQELQAHGNKVALIAGKEGEPGTSTADYVLIRDLKDEDSIISFFHNYGVKAVIIGTGHVFAINLAQTLKLQGFTLSIDPSISQLCKDKYLFKRRIEELGFRTPKYHLVSPKEGLHNIASIINTIGLPCVTKSTIDLVQPEKVFSPERLHDSVETILALESSALIEEYIDGNDCTIPVVSNGNNVQDLGVLYYSKAREYQLSGFKGAKSEKMGTALERKICDDAVRLVKTIGIIGVSRIDYIVKDDDFYVLEANSIIVTGYHGSAYPFFKQQGINISKVAVCNALETFKYFEGIDV